MEVSLSIVPFACKCALRYEVCFKMENKKSSIKSVKKRTDPRRCFFKIKKKGGEGNKENVVICILCSDKG